MTLEPEKRSI